MCPGCLGDQYTGFGAQTVDHKKDFSRFLSSIVSQHKICWSSAEWFYNESNYFKMA